MEVYELYKVAKEVGVPAWELERAEARHYDGYRQMLWIDHRVEAETIRKARHGKAY